MVTRQIRRETEDRALTEFKADCNEDNDDSAKFSTQFHKEPEDVDEAVHHVVNLIHTRKSTLHEAGQ